MTTAPEPAGPWTAVRHGTRWTIEFALDDTRKHPLYDTRDLTQTEADKRNQQYAQARAPRPPKPVQPDLFNNQEAI
jgi:hypothetical protein